MSELKPRFSPAVSPVEVRKSVLSMLHRAKASHLGSNMSAIEILMAIYSSVDCMKIRNREPDRSRVLVSKGHCAAATYATMAAFGVIPSSALETYHLDGSTLTGHVNHMVDGVEHSTGALGHGINVAVGCALGLRARGFPDRPVFAMVGDGELQEGSIWEAIMFTTHMNLSNLVILVDNNGISSITETEKVIDMRPITSRFRGFGMETRQVDGHNLSEVIGAIQSIQGSGRPGVIVCDTIKGKDIPFAERQPIWHYRSLTDQQYSEALVHLEKLEIKE